MYSPTTCESSPSAISLQVSAFGRTPSAPQAGPMTDLFGLVPVLANLSARQAKALRLLTSGTYGPPSTTSSKSASLNASLVSKLQARLLMTGSTLYTLTWKPWVTPSGVSRFRLRASVRRTSETETIGLEAAWPAPTTRDWKDGGFQPNVPLNSLLGRVAWLAGWPTPQSSDSTGGGQAKRAMGETRHGSNLNDFAMLSGWPTPSCSNDRTGKPESALSMQRQGGSKVQQRLQDFAAICGPARLTVSGEMLTGSDAEMESGGQLSPAMSRWLMGLPPAWCECAPNKIKKGK